MAVPHDPLLPRQPHAPQINEVYSKPRKEPLHEEKIIMIDSVIKYHKPQITADKRRFVVPVLSSFLILIDANQQNNHFFAPFAYWYEKKLATNPTNSNELTSEFVLVRTSSLLFSCSFMTRRFIANFAVKIITNPDKSPRKLPHNIFDNILKTGVIPP